MSIVCRGLGRKAVAPALLVTAGLGLWGAGPEVPSAGGGGLSLMRAANERQQEQKPKRNLVAINNQIIVAAMLTILSVEDE